MFDTNQTIEIPAPYRLGEDAKLHIRWPTDPEWYTRARAKRFVNRRLGRGRNEQSLPQPGEADLKLYETISLNGSPPITAVEASQVLDAIGVASATDAGIEDGLGMVKLETMNGTVTHRMKIPTADQI